MTQSCWIISVSFRYEIIQRFKCLFELSGASIVLTIDWIEILCRTCLANGSLLILTFFEETIQTTLSKREISVVTAYRKLGLF